MNSNLNLIQMETFQSTNKSLKIFLVLVLLSLFITTETTFAHGKPPKWAPAKGYRTKTRHIYFPQQNFYYDIQTSNYFYLKNGNWTVSVSIPSPFININLGSVAQIQLDYYGATPYYYNTNHCAKYRKVKVYPTRTKVIVSKERKTNAHHGSNRKHAKKNGDGRGHGNDK